MGDLYLTKLQLPDASYPRTGGPLDDDQRTSQRYSLNQDVDSDSDNDEGVSEAMRDARLAQVNLFSWCWVFLTSFVVSRAL